MKTPHQLISKNIILTLIIAVVVALAALLLLAPEASAQVDSIRQGVGSTGESVPEGQAEGRVFGVVETAINIFSIIVGVVSVIMIIIGGLKYITSTGDSGKVDSAKNTILYAVIGLVVVVLAQVIVIYVLDQVGGAGSSGEDESGETSQVEAI